METKEEISPDESVVRILSECRVSLFAEARRYCDDVGDADQHQDQHLFENPLRSDGAGELPVDHRTHDAGDVVDGDEYHQGNQQPVHAAEHVAQDGHTE